MSLAMERDIFDNFREFRNTVNLAGIRCKTIKHPAFKQDSY